MKQLRKIAKSKGVEMSTREGGSHTKVMLGDHFVMVPRHTEINERTALGIIDDAKRG